MWFVDTPDGIKRRIGDIIGKFVGGTISTNSIQDVVQKTIKELAVATAGSIDQYGLRGTVSITSSGGGNPYGYRLTSGVCCTNQGVTISVDSDITFAISGNATPHHIFVEYVGAELDQSATSIAYNMIDGGKKQVVYKSTGKLTVVPEGGGNAPTNAVRIGSCTTYIGGQGHNSSTIVLSGPTDGITAAISIPGGSPSRLIFQNGILVGTEE